MRRNELIVFALIMVIAAGFRLYGLPSASQNLVYSAIAGILTVLGTYVLTRHMFSNWEIAALAAFLMAIGSWHVYFSRAGLHVIFAPLITVWMLYFIFLGMRSHRLLHWGIAGLFLGIGMYTDPIFRIIPIITALMMLIYWRSLRTAFSHDRYTYARNQFLKYATVCFGITFVVCIPLILQFRGFTMTHCSYQQCVVNFVQGFGMFFFRSDLVLFWPVAGLFAVGLIRTIIKVGNTLKTHRNISTIHGMLLLWFLIGLAYSAVSDGSISKTVLLLIISPAVYIMAGEGLWWLALFLKRWYIHRDVHQLCVHGHRDPRHCTSEGNVFVILALITFCVALGIAEINRYFIQ